MIDMAAAEAAIADSRAGLEASGFALACSGRDDTLVVRILAGPEACTECLVPKPVLTQIIACELAEHGVRVGAVEVVYP